MTPEDREFIVRALAAHAALVNGDGDDARDRYREFIVSFANTALTPAAREPRTVRTADGREFLVRDRTKPSPSPSVTI